MLVGMHDSIRLRRWVLFADGLAAVRFGLALSTSQRQCAVGTSYLEQATPSTSPHDQMNFPFRRLHHTIHRTTVIPQPSPQYIGRIPTPGSAQGARVDDIA